ncbi:DUF6232 family protein [Streptomyces colonosanans]|uniref:Uncharacterized protein n=1 Tax=Streptomyces colonosanans TaxID=1428652 RepID=A0A1S2Q1W5_9ACTN|nr:DUF6232 family protein [Streptomyces colonosanans]OIK00102.1 hypothetical protein BIV24_03540 [Streptomyces colonosanans]
MQPTHPPGQPDVPPPAPPPHLLSGVDLRVSKRLLWIDRAAYPLQNIARVYTFNAHPRRKEAALRFAKSAAIILAVAFGLTIIGGLTQFGGRNSGGTLITLAWVGSAAGLIYCFVQMMSVLTAQSHYVMAIETSGPSQAVVTSSNPETLNQLVGYVAHAIDNPETEFQVKVERLMISPNNYYFGDNVNMYGGTGNVGIAA